MAEARQFSTSITHFGILAVEEFLNGEDQILGSALFLDRIGVDWDQQFLSYTQDKQLRLEQEKKGGTLSHQESVLLGCIYYSRNMLAESRVCFEEAGQAYQKEHKKDYGLSLLLLTRTKLKEGLADLEIFNNFNHAVEAKTPNAIVNRQHWISRAYISTERKTYKRKLEEEILKCRQELRESKEADLSYQRWYILGQMFYEYSRTLRDLLDGGFLKKIPASQRVIDELLNNALVCYEYAITCYKRDKGIEYKWALWGIGQVYYDKTLYEDAFKYFCKASEQDLPEAVFRVGRCLEQGVGTKKNAVRALEYYERSAKMIYWMSFDKALKLLFDDSRSSRELSHEQQMTFRTRFFRQTHATGMIVNKDTGHNGWVYGLLEGNLTKKQIKHWFKEFVRDNPIFGWSPVRISSLYEATLGFLENKLEQGTLGKAVIEKFKLSAMKNPERIVQASLGDSWSVLHGFLIKILDAQLIDTIYQGRINYITSLFLRISFLSRDPSFIVLAYLGIGAVSSDAERQCILNESVRLEQRKTATEKSKSASVGLWFKTKQHTEARQKQKVKRCQVLPYYHSM